MFRNSAKLGQILKPLSLPAFQLSFPEYFKNKKMAN